MVKVAWSRTGKHVLVVLAPFILVRGMPRGIVVENGASFSVARHNNPGASPNHGASTTTARAQPESSRDLYQSNLRHAFTSL